jgi:negative regulator of sigma E activity
VTHASWTDEQISAFLDGELNQAETEALALAVERDPALAARVERFGAATRAYVSAVAAIDQHPMPDGVKQILSAPPTAKVIPFRAKVGAFLTEHRAIAASLLCAAAVWGVSSSLGGQSGNVLQTAPDGLIVASSPLHRALETGATSAPVQIAANVTATPRLTFASAEGGFCRQFDVSSPAGATSAIACREDGQWRTQVAVFGKAGGGDYQTAAGGKSPALEAFIDEHISGAPLDMAEEAKVLSERWTRSDR